MGLVVLLILLGVFFLVVELIFLPGVTLGTILSVASYGAAIYLAFDRFGFVGGMITLFVVVALSLVATRKRAPKMKLVMTYNTRKTLVLKKPLLKLISTSSKTAFPSGKSLFPKHRDRQPLRPLTNLLTSLKTQTALKCLLSEIPDLLSTLTISTSPLAILLLLRALVLPLPRKKLVGMDLRSKLTATP